MPDNAREASCFFEIDGSLPILRRSFVEAVGTCLLTVAMVGSGLAVQQKQADEPLVASIIIAVSIAGSLVGLIVALGKVSGGHYNPLITIGQWLRGERATACTISYVLSQIAGGICGSLIATFMFQETVRPSFGETPSMGLAVSEFVAAAGLLIIVISCARSSKWDTGPFAVGAWLTAAILATPSTSYANPAVTIAATFAEGPVSLSLPTAATFAVAQLLGLVAALLVTRIAFGGTPAQDNRSEGLAGERARDPSGL
ncbi:aquaporin [Rhizobium laguerreae]|uniref:aquaporin n=1 Tax=Rhizobium laguerreae TaxID=1076926 RepID=UPI001C8FDAD6|nr:aquaporin [Rhizobium laguerreae]MBY3321180.1 MIP family protein [Rhizobium laguerreae]